MTNQRKFDELLLIEVQAHTNLYDIKSKQFKDVVKRHNSWTAIADGIGGKLLGLFCVQALAATDSCHKGGGGTVANIVFEFVDDQLFNFFPHSFCREGTCRRLCVQVHISCYFLLMMS